VDIAATPVPLFLHHISHEASFLFKKKFERFTNISGVCVYRRALQNGMETKRGKKCPVI
jgi:hypothetical protein